MSDKKEVAHPDSRNCEVNVMKDVEFWKELKEIPGYEASTLGRIRNKNTGKVLAVEWRDNHKGRRDARVGIKGKHYLVSRLVATTFLPVHEKGMTINHVDGDLRNNAVSNLEWMTRKDNVHQAILNGSYCNVVGVVKLKECGSEIELEFLSVSDAADFVGCSHGAMRRACYNQGAVCDSEGKMYSVIAKCSDRFLKNVKREADLCKNQIGLEELLIM